MPCDILPPGCYPSFNDDPTREQAMTRDSTSEEAQAGVHREGQIGGDGSDETAREPKSSERIMMDDSDPPSLPFYSNSNVESSCRAQSDCQGAYRDDVVPLSCKQGTVLLKLWLG